MNFKIIYFKKVKTQVFREFIARYYKIRSKNFKYINKKWINKI